MKNFLFKKLFFNLFLSFLILQSFSQESTFNISAQYRLRAEVRHGYRTLTTDSSKTAFFIAQRARLIFDYNHSKFQIYSSIQDSRTWGDEEQRKDIGGLQVNELWIELKTKKRFNIKLGRQELAYDDHRLLGNLDWANLTISHDALVVKYANNEKKIWWHIGGAFNQLGEPIFGTNYTLKNNKGLGFTWLKKEFNKGHTLSALAIVNVMNATNTTDKKAKTTYTFGPLYNYDFNNTKATIGAYYQGGKTESDLSQSAFMINLYIERKIKHVTIGLGTDYLSGNSDKTAATESRNFNTLYATNHKFYGYMDYFISFPNDTKGRGLIDVFSKIKYTATKPISAALDFHYFLLANENNLNTTKIKRPLGFETDFLFDYKITPIIQLQIGYSMLFATKNMEAIKGGNAKKFNTWAFAMLKVTPTFLNLVKENK